MPNNLAFIIILVVLVGLIAWSFTRRRKSGSYNIDIVMGILANIEDSLRTVEVRLVEPQSKKKFQDASWKAFGRKLGFLDPALLTTLTEAFTLVEDFNQRIDSARKSKMLSTLQDMPVESLKAPLLKAREGLIAWMKIASEAELKNRRGCLGF